ncbi:MAG TPA: aconitase X catalytic domain-containing protein [Actinomycetota bacterium]|nr:aconitase X catalytic domain-containing protein [Actinomycetota bacterium]
MQLDEWDRACLAGANGPAARFAMNILVRMGEIRGAARMIDIASAHIDSCLYHGTVGLDFAERLGGWNATVRVPTTLNVSSLDLLHPNLYRGDAETAEAARRLMDLYVSMGCTQTWTCAPYQLPQRPAFGEHIAWAESNAIVFANSVLGARTDRYGDFIDICAAITGRAPEAGLHVESMRAATSLFDVRSLSDRIMSSSMLYPVLGHLIGGQTGDHVPVIVGLPEETSEDDLKALGAAAASSGSVALFHAVGLTPEAPSLDAALQGAQPKIVVEATDEAMNAAARELSTAATARIDAVSVGTPHLSQPELRQLADQFGHRRVNDRVAFYASTGRDVLRRAKHVEERLERAGVRLVTDTCTYITPILDPSARVVMTDSAKWAYYAPGNVGVDVVFASRATCVESAIAGEFVERDPWD